MVNVKDLLLLHVNSVFSQVWLRFQLHQHSNLPIRVWTLGRTWTSIHSAVQHLGPLAEQYMSLVLVG